MDFKIGDIVARKSYNYDVLFRVIHISNDGVADLVGITTRILADAYLYDLKLIGKDELNARLKNISNSRRTRMNRSYDNLNKNRGAFNNYRENSNFSKMYQREKTYKKPGSVLHLDGDGEYCKECKKIYKEMGLNAIIYNLNENKRRRNVKWINMLKLLQL